MKPFLILDFDDLPEDWNRLLDYEIIDHLNARMIERGVHVFKDPDLRCHWAEEIGIPCHEEAIILCRRPINLSKPECNHLVGMAIRSFALHAEIKFCPECGKDLK